MKKVVRGLEVTRPGEEKEEEGSQAEVLQNSRGQLGGRQLVARVWNDPGRAHLLWINPRETEAPRNNWKTWHQMSLGRDHSAPPT